MLGCAMGGEIAIDFTLEYAEMAVSLVIVSGTLGGFEMHGKNRHLRFWRCCRLLDRVPEVCK